MAPPEVIQVAPPAAERRPEEIKLVSPPSIRMAPCKVSPTSDVVSISVAMSQPAPIQVSPPAPVQVAPPAVEVAPSTEHRNKMKVDLTRLNKDRNGPAAGRTPLGINVMKVKPVTLEVLSPTGENDKKVQNVRESSKTNESTPRRESVERNKVKENGSFVSQVTMSVNSDVKPKLPSEFDLVPSNSVNKESSATLTGTKVTPLQKSDSLVYQMTLSLNDPKALGGAGAKVQTAPPWRASSVRTGVASVKESPFKQSEATGKPVASYMKDQKSNGARHKAGSPSTASYVKSKSPASQVTTMTTLKPNSVSAASDRSRAQGGNRLASTTAVSLQKPRLSSLSNKDVNSKVSTEPEAPTARKVNSKFAQMQQKFSGSSASSLPKDKGFGTVYSKTKPQVKSDVSVSNTNEKRQLSKPNTDISSKTTRVMQMNGSKDDAATAATSSTKSSLIVQVTNSTVTGKLQPVHQKGQPVSLIIENEHRKDPLPTMPPTRTAKTEDASVSVNKSPSTCVISDAPLSSKSNGGVAETNNNTYVQSQTLSMKSSSLKSSDPPQFVRRLEDQTVMDGDRVAFVVEITGRS